MESRGLGSTVLGLMTLGFSFGCRVLLVKGSGLWALGFGVSGFKGHTRLLENSNTHAICSKGPGHLWGFPNIRGPFWGSQ